MSIYQGLAEYKKLSVVVLHVFFVPHSFLGGSVDEVPQFFLGVASRQLVDFQKLALETTPVARYIASERASEVPQVQGYERSP